MPGTPNTEHDGRPDRRCARRPVVAAGGPFAWCFLAGMVIALSGSFIAAADEATPIAPPADSLVALDPVEAGVPEPVEPTASEKSAGKSFREIHAADLPPAPDVTRAEIRQSIDRGIAFLVAAQNKDGSWGSAERTKDLNIYAPIPGAHQGFRAATTSLAISTLIEAEVAADSPAGQALARAELWLLEHLAAVRRANGDAIYNVWAHGYSLQALVRMLPRAKGDAERIAKIGELIRLQFQRLTDYESVDGGWGYYDFRIRAAKPGSDGTSFTSAAILVALYEAQQAGFEPPERLVRRAIRSIERQRLPDQSYLYGEYLRWHPRAGINRPGGSLGRSQSCHYALRVWGDTTITDDLLEDWLTRLVLRNGWLDVGRKRPVPHESWFQVAGYFYYFGHYYAGLTLELLPAERREPYARHLAAILLKHQERDGSWWDYPFYNYHQPYGTAYSVMTLLRCERSLPDSP